MVHIPFWKYPTIKSYSIMVLIKECSFTFGPYGSDESWEVDSCLLQVSLKNIVVRQVLDLEFVSFMVDLNARW